MESTLESQISDTLSHPEGGTFEKTPSHTEINEKLSDEDDRTVDDDEKLGLIDNENNLQAKNAENIRENDVVQRSCEEFAANKSEGESQEKEEEDDDTDDTDDRNKKAINTEENNDDGNISEENNGENRTDPDEEDSWEYEWEDEEDNEFEFFEVDEDEYKVQTFDGSFSIAI